MKRLFDPLLQFGVRDDLPLDRAIAIRASNAILIFLVASMSAVSAASYLDIKSPELAAMNGVFVLLYLIAYLLNGSRLYDAARLSVILLACIHFAIANAALGPRSGMVFYLPALAVLPILMFTKKERRMRLVAYGVIVVATIIVVFVLSLGSGFIAAPEDALVRAYYATLALLTVGTAAVVAYYNSSFIAAQVGLELERQRVEQLLSHLLPDLIAERLKHGDITIADSHGEATVLFADLAGFTGLAKKLAPTHVVEILNDLFSRLDKFAKDHGVEKIKTIGDCYMAASGVLAQPTGEVAAMADFALEIPGAVREVAKTYGYPLAVRVGISTGHAISGVIGTEKYSFDLWGDTVNLASQMEASGVEGRIQVTEATYWRLRDAFDFEERGEVTLKGAAKVPTYFLMGRKSADGGMDHGAGVDNNGSGPRIQLVK